MEMKSRSVNHGVSGVKNIRRPLEQLDSLPVSILHLGKSRFPNKVSSLLLDFSFTCLHHHLFIHNFSPCSFPPSHPSLSLNNFCSSLTLLKHTLSTSPFPTLTAVFLNSLFWCNTTLSSICVSLSWHRSLWR